MVAAYIPLQLGVEIREATRLLIAWNVGAWAFLFMILHMVSDPRREARVFSRPEDENQWVLVGPRHCRVSRGHGRDRVGARAGQEHGRLGKDGSLGAGRRDGAQRLDVPAGDVRAALRGRLFPAPQGRHFTAVSSFRATPQPEWMEFFYQAFVIGCTFASSDVNVTSMRMRRIVVIQGVACFFFNAIILALTINVAANLF